jgi:hypothetical protein
MPPIIMRRGLIDLSTRTPLSIARLRASAPSSHDLSLAAFTISMAESSFRHTHGNVNQSLPDPELDAFVDALARRIASFDKQAIAETKHLVDIASLPSDAEISLEWDAFIASLSRPASQHRIKALMERGFHRPGDVEDRLGYHVGQLGG